MPAFWGPVQSDSLKKTSLICFGLGLSALFLRLSRPGIDLWWTAWFAFVPLLWVSRHLSPTKAFWAGMSCYFLGLLAGFSWLQYLALNYIGLPQPFDWAFYLLFVFYISLSLGCVLGIWRFISLHTTWPDFILFPLAHAFVWHFFPFLFDYGLAETQIPAPFSLQGLNLLGGEAMNFLLPLANGLLYYLLKLWADPEDLKKRLHLAIAGIMAIALMVWLIYGGFSYTNWKKNVAHWPIWKVGIVQPNLTASFAEHRPTDPSQLIEIQLTSQLHAQGVSTVFWPEGNSYRYTYDPQVRQAFQAYVRTNQLNLIFAELYPQPNGHWYNAALWLKPDGSEALPYFKRILVPFGEYLPFAPLFQPFTKLLGVHFTSLSPGTEAVHFNLPEATLVPLLCYESLYGDFVAHESRNTTAPRVLLNLSQDGWYGSILQTAEHSYIAALRAIETRSPLVHVVQNGFSSLVSPSGDFLAITPYEQAGGWIFSIPLPEAGASTFYMAYPWVFSALLWLSCLAVLGSLLFKWRKRLTNI